MTSNPPLPLLLVGPLTTDQIEGRRLSGGSIAYSAAVAAAFGIRARILTVAGPEADLSSIDDHDVHLIDGTHTMTFILDSTRKPRKIRMLKRPTRSLSAKDIPENWHSNGTLILSPLIQGDLDIPSFKAICASSKQVGIMTQGLQRTLEGDQVNVTPPHDYSFVRTCTNVYTFFRSEREASHWPHHWTNLALERGARLVTTYGQTGAELQHKQQRLQIEAFPARNHVDATGAGDVFATAFILALNKGEAKAAQIAAAFAAASVENIGPMPLPDLEEIEQRVIESQLNVNQCNRRAIT